MLYTIHNSDMTVTIDGLGAQLQSITAAGGTEYLWSGDPAYWSSRAPILFPYVGRLTDDTYTCDGRAYQMTRHGFARRTEFSVLTQGKDHISLYMEDSEESRKLYPFAFRFDVSYVLEGNTLVIVYAVESRDGRTMFFGLGGHPGFRVPLEEGRAFTDYRLTFAQPCQPWQVLMSENYMISGREAPYPLENGVDLPLRHDLFDRDAIILKHFARSVTLSAGEGTRGLTLSCPRMRYLGIWHQPKTDAPYVCLEPWVSLPSREGVVEDLSQQFDLVSLEPRQRYENRWTVTVF
ncbi:MAG: aldose 1-epimerase family protein [Oscillospiraceae bacterium]|jgi:galactose mutarotase-like enzyme|nr:aldose 1-epimerase family protein [Oscillospiraceae bacterium]